MSEVAAPGQVDGSDGTAIDRLLRDIVEQIVALFDSTFPAGAVRVDVDVFEGSEALVAGVALDSMDLVRTIAVLEDRYGVPLADLLSGDEPLTLVAVARYVAGAGS
jgi:acyl carrier protein